MASVRTGQPNELKAFWDKAATENAISAVCYHHTEAELDASGKAQAEYLLQVLRRSPLGEDPSQCRVLDLGAGVGRIAKHLAPHVREYVLADVSAVMLAKARERLAGIDNCDYIELPGYGLLEKFPNCGQRREFDFAICDLVLQHLDRELQAHYLREIKFLLCRGAWLWLYVPTMRYPERWEDMNRGDFPANIRRWHPGELLEVCVRMGWSVVAADLDGIQMVLENRHGDFGWLPARGDR